MLQFFSVWSLIRLFPLFIFTLIFNNVYDPKNVFTRLKSYGYILVHPLNILRKRKAIQQQRKVSDQEIFKYMSYKLFEEENVSSALFKAVLKFFNMLSYYYCKIFGITTIEMHPELPW